MRKLYDFIVVGAGLSGAVAAYELTRKGYSVLVIEKADEIGGLCRCKIVNGIPVHSFGPHIFHTSNKEIWDFVNDKCEMLPYEHVVRAYYSEEMPDISLPININTVERIYGVHINNEDEVSDIIKDDIVKYDCPRTVEEQALSTVGRRIYDVLIKEYTERQWGKPCSELPAEILKRLQIRNTRNESYFSDKYVGIPKNGWNELFDSLLSDCDIIKNTDYLSAKEYYNKIAGGVIYTGKIDEYFDYKFGRLEYIDHAFETAFGNDAKWSANSAVVNMTCYGDLFPLRTANYALMYGHKSEKYYGGHIIEEYRRYDNANATMYPVPTLGKNIRLNMYRCLAENEENVLFIGRNAEYKYYDMDDCIIRSKEAIGNE